MISVVKSGHETFTISEILCGWYKIQSLVASALIIIRHSDEILEVSFLPPLN